MRELARSGAIVSGTENNISTPWSHTLLRHTMELRYGCMWQTKSPLRCDRWSINQEFYVRNNPDNAEIFGC